MRYSDIRAWTQDLTPKGNLRKRSRDRLSQVTQPPATPARPPTGNRADHQGNVYAMHSGSMPSLRMTRRDKGTGQIQFKRSRIQRARRKQRTGGVR